jgi:hypothetical protein
LCNVSDKIAEDSALEKYLYENGGPVVGYGPFNKGYINILIHEECGNISQSNLKEIYDIFEIYAFKEDMSDVPVIFSIEKTPSFSVSEATETMEKASALAVLGYNSSFRPVIGGVGMETSKLLSGTVGFAAIQNGTNQKGFVTAAHLSNFSRATVYQPLLLHPNGSVGSMNVNYTNIDAAFVPCNNVNGTKFYSKVLNNSSVRQYANGTEINHSVGGYYGTIGNNYTVLKSGKATGLTSGTTIGYYNNYTFVGVKLDRLGVVEPCIGTGGDSGGPIFHIREDGKAYLMGTITGGSGTLGINGRTYYTPCTEITKLGYVPLFRE